MLGVRGDRAGALEGAGGHGGRGPLLTQPCHPDQLSAALGLLPRVM